MEHLVSYLEHFANARDCRPLSEAYNREMKTANEHWSLMTESERNRAIKYLTSWS